MSIQKSFTEDIAMPSGPPRLKFSSQRGILRLQHVQGFFVLFNQVLLQTFHLQVKITRGLCPDLNDCQTHLRGQNFMEGRHGVALL